jgi:glycerate 2-kinase
MPDTLQRGLQKGMKVNDYLDRNDAYGYFSAINDLVITGPTHTNVNDFRALLIL